jgi:cell division protein FtsA
VMRGMVELGEEIFHMPVRLGTPRYATAIGLLLEGQSQTERGIQALQGASLRQVMSRMKDWFQRNF